MRHEGPPLRKPIRQPSLTDGTIDRIDYRTSDPATITLIPPCGLSLPPYAGRCLRQWLTFSKETLTNGDRPRIENHDRNRRGGGCWRPGSTRQDDALPTFGCARYVYL